jgi:hypothetical protein
MIRGSLADVITPKFELFSDETGAFNCVLLSS